MELKACHGAQDLMDEGWVQGVVGMSYSTFVVLVQLRIRPLIKHRPGYANTVSLSCLNAVSIRMTSIYSRTENGKKQLI